MSDQTGDVIYCGILKGKLHAFMQQFINASIDRCDQSPTQVKNNVLLSRIFLGTEFRGEIAICPLKGGDKMGPGIENLASSASR